MRALGQEDLRKMSDSAKMVMASVHHVTDDDELVRRVVADVISHCSPSL
jgi:hypothetical protein